MQTSPLDKIATGASNYEKYKDLFTDDRNDVVTMDSFYKLLVAEMSNQDPLEPTSNTEFISQLASFTSLQAQQDNFAMQKQNYANSLVGQTVSVQGSAKDDLVTGVVESVSYGDETMIVVNGKSYKLSAIKQFYGSAGGDTTSSGTATSLGNYGAFAAGILGKTVMVQAKDANGETVLDRGTVSSLEIENGEVRVVVNGMAYDVSEIVQVTEDSGILSKLPTDEDPGDEEETTPEKAENPSVQAPETPKTETNDSAAAELTGSLTERTDDADIPDLIEDDADDVPTDGTVQPEDLGTNGQGTGTGTWTSETQPWVTEQEANELYSLFGEN